VLNAATHGVPPASKRSQGPATAPASSTPLDPEPPPEPELPPESGPLLDPEPPAAPELLDPALPSGNEEPLDPDAPLATEAPLDPELPPKSVPPEVVLPLELVLPSAPWVLELPLEAFGDEQEQTLAARPTPVAASSTERR
jgi:hypothetical protein